MDIQQFAAPYHVKSQKDEIGENIIPDKLRKLQLADPIYGHQTSNSDMPEPLNSVICYKKRVKMFLQMVVLPLCGGIIIFILAIPYFHHHLKLLGITLVSILAVGLIISLWLQKSKNIEAQTLDEKIDYLRKSYETEQAYRDKSASEKQVRKAKRDELSIFLDRGDEILKGLQCKNTQSFSDKVSWEKDVVGYLTKWEQSSVSRFQNPDRSAIQSSRKEDVAIGELQARMSILHDFISGLQD